MIRTGRSDYVRILSLAILVPWTHYGGSVAIAKGKWLDVFTDRVYFVVVRVTMARSKGFLGTKFSL